MATVAGAYAQGREHESGRIMEGFDADLMLLDFHRPHLHPCHNVISNVVYAAKGSDVCLTMCKGKVLYKDGVFMTLDIERAYYDMEHTTLPCILGK
jgi:5-methylthioadenosine/S-adenosylhomocysteine deaminase